MRPFSYSTPKQLFPLANKPVLSYAIENLRAVDITEIGIVVGRLGAHVKNAIGDGSQYGVRVTYIPQDEPLGLADCVLRASRYLGRDDFVMYLGDNFLPDGIELAAQEFLEHAPAAQIAVQKVANPRRFGVANVDTEGGVTGIAEKPDEPMSEMAVLGVYFFSSAIREAVNEITPSARGELEITDAIQWLISQESCVRAHEYGGYWRDVGHLDDALDCNRYVLSRLTTSIRGDVDDSSSVIGPVVIERGAQIRASHVRGPAIIGQGSLIEHSYIGPGTSVGSDCLITDMRVEASIVQDGAELSRSGRLVDSVIGKHAALRSWPPSQRLPSYRLHVGDSSILEVPAAPSVTGADK
jgi:glucose-1-phosphate thymidylyltransferase